MLSTWNTARAKKVIENISMRRDSVILSLLPARIHAISFEDEVLGQPRRRSFCGPSFSKITYSFSPGSSPWCLNICPQTSCSTLNQFNERPQLFLSTNLMWWIQQKQLNPWIIVWIFQHNCNALASGHSIWHKFQAMDAFDLKEQSTAYNVIQGRLFLIGI